MGLTCFQLAETIFSEKIFTVSARQWQRAARMPADEQAQPASQRFFLAANKNKGPGKFPQAPSYN